MHFASATRRNAAVAAGAAAVAIPVQAVDVRFGFGCGIVWITIRVTQNVFFRTERSCHMSALKNWLFRSKLTTRRCSRSARFQYRFACLLLFCPATALAAHAVSQGTCETPLIAAIHHRDFAQVKKIIDSRQDLDAKGCEGGSTPLIESIALNEPEVTERLVLSGANPNLSDGKHDSPLTVAAWYCRLETVPLLLAHGAEVNAVDVDGYSALMNSVQNCDDGRVSALLLG